MYGFGLSQDCKCKNCKRERNAKNRILKYNRSNDSYTYLKNASPTVDDILRDVKKLKFSSNFNFPIFKGVIPESVNVLTFGHCFNQPITNIIPPFVKKLQFGNNFNQCISLGDIPSGVEKLVFGKCFNKNIEVGAIPNSVKILIFRGNFSKFIYPELIPRSVSVLIFNETRYYYNTQIYIHRNLVKLEISNECMIYNKQCSYPIWNIFTHRYFDYKIRNKIKTILMLLHFKDNEYFKNNEHFNGSDIMFLPIELLFKLFRFLY